MIDPHPAAQVVTLAYQAGRGHLRTARALARASTAVGLLIVAHPIVWYFLSTILVSYLSQPCNHVQELAALPFTLMPMLLVALLAPTGLALSLFAWSMGARLYSVSFGILASLIGAIIGILHLLL